MINNNDFIRAGGLIENIPLMDLHIHTKYSDGRSTIEEYIDEALCRSYEWICFTDHVDHTTTWFDKYIEKISSLQEDNPYMRISHGLEVRARDREGRTLNAPDNIVDNAEIVIGVVHSIPAVDGIGKHRPEEFSAEKLLEIEFNTSLGLLENDSVTILGHPMSNYEKIYGQVPVEYYRELLLAAKRSGKVVEISAKYKNDFKEFLRACIEVDMLVSLGSDAHSILELGLVKKRLEENIYEL